MDEYGNDTSPEDAPPVFTEIPGLRELGPAPAQPQADPEAVVKAAVEERVVEAERIDCGTFGIATKPKEESLWGYQYTLKNDEGMHFFPQAYGFDDIIVRECGVSPKGYPIHIAFAPGNSHYNRFAPLRRNLAILRNYLMVHYPYEGPQRERNISKLEAMAHELGRALRSGTGSKARRISLWQMFLQWLYNTKSQPSQGGRFIDFANIPDRGIAYMYEYLRKLDAVLGSGNSANPSAQSPRDWKLRPLDQTPFSDENMLRYSRSSRMGKIVDAYDIVAEQIQAPDELKLRSVSELHEQEKRTSVKHARDILENMRIIVSKAEEQKVDVEDPHVHEAGLMLKVAVTYRDALTDMVKTDPSVINDPEVSHASQATAKIGYRLKVEEKEMLKEEVRPEAAKQAEKKVKKSSSRNKSKETTAVLLRRIDTGLFRFEKMERKKSANRSHHHTLELHEDALESMKDDLHSTMSGGKITQVSKVGLVKAAKHANEPEPKLEKKEKTEDQHNRGPSK